MKRVEARCNWIGMIHLSRETTLSLRWSNQMNTHKLVSTRRRLLPIFCAAALTFTVSAPVFAAGDGTEAVLNGGALTVPNVSASDFTGDDLDLDGAAGSVQAILGFTVIDATGTGAGWRVTAQASQFTGSGGTPKLLAPASLSMTAPTVEANGTTSSEPAVATGPFVIDNGSAVQIAAAAVDDGMGRFDFSESTLTLSYPADVYADTYASVVTITAISGPEV